MTAPDAAGLPATLAGIKERQALASDASLGFARIDERHDAMLKSCYEDNPRLVAALEAVLKAAGEFERSVCDCGGSSCAPQGAALTSCAAKIREAITAALTGETTATQQLEEQ